MMTPEHDPAALPVGVKASPKCAGLSDRGRRRTMNEDRWVVIEAGTPVRILGLEFPDPLPQVSMEPGRGALLVVADGCGGHAGGELAATAAVAALVRGALHEGSGIRTGSPSDPAADSVIEAAMEACRKAVVEAAQQTPAAADMATTLTMAWLSGETLLVGHAGDSRCYILRDGRLSLLTTDHSIAHELKAEGLLSAEQEIASPLSHVLSNALGPGSDMKPEIRRTAVRAGDVILLCTDGLTRHVSDDLIAGILGEAKTAPEACDRLVAEANDRGGSDNITCIVARVAGAPPSLGRRRAAKASQRYRSAPAPAVRPPPPPRETTAPAEILPVPGIAVPMAGAV